MEKPHHRPDAVSENGILKQEEFSRYKGRSISTKFKQQLFLGVGGATVFGLAGAAGKALLDVIGGSTAATVATTAATTATTSSTAVIAGLTAVNLAWIGLAALAVIGIASIYLGSKYLSESIMLDQDFQAKKIGFAARGPAPIMEQEKGGQIAPVGMGSNVDRDTETDEVSAAPKTDWSVKFAPVTAATSFVDRAAADKIAEASAIRA